MSEPLKVWIPEGREARRAWIVRRLRRAAPMVVLVSLICTVLDVIDWAVRTPHTVANLLLRLACLLVLFPLIQFAVAMVTLKPEPAPREPDQNPPA